MKGLLEDEVNGGFAADVVVVLVVTGSGLTGFVSKILI